MSSRKRKTRTSPETVGNSSKRARLLSNLWQSQGQDSGNIDQNRTLFSSPVNNIGAIIGERRNEYLIDWADDPVTGKAFHPDWVSLSRLDDD